MNLPRRLLAVFTTILSGTGLAPSGYAQGVAGNAPTALCTGDGSIPRVLVGRFTPSGGGETWESRLAGELLSAGAASALSASEQITAALFRTQREGGRSALGESMDEIFLAGGRK